jgi:hypothetical protein
VWTVLLLLEVCWELVAGIMNNQLEQDIETGGGCLVGRLVASQDSK